MYIQYNVHYMGKHIQINQMSSWRPQKAPTEWAVNKRHTSELLIGINPYCLEWFYVPICCSTEEESLRCRVMKSIIFNHLYTNLQACCKTVQREERASVTRKAEEHKCRFSTQIVSSDVNKMPYDPTTRLSQNMTSTTKHLGVASTIHSTDRSLCRTTKVKLWPRLTEAAGDRLSQMWLQTLRQDDQGTCCRTPRSKGY